MKRILVAMMILCSTQFAFAYDAANIKIKVSGAIHDNSYFLCLPDIGCLSIYAAKTKGKVYPVLHNIDMPHIYVTDVNNFSVYPQGLPESCKVKVKTNQTITIHGDLVKSTDGKVHINNLGCSVS